MQGLNFNEMRSKTKVNQEAITSGKPEDHGDWSYDGSSTGQAEGNFSDCILRCAAAAALRLHLAQHVHGLGHAPSQQISARPSRSTPFIGCSHSGRRIALMRNVCRLRHCWTRDRNPKHTHALCRPVYVVDDPIRGGENVLVLCMVMKPDGKPHETNHRQPLMDILDDEILAAEPLYGFEQEYTMMKVRALTPGRRARQHRDWFLFLPKTA